MAVAAFSAPDRISGEGGPIDDAAFRPFGISSLDDGGNACPVAESRVGSFRFGVLRRFSCEGATLRRRKVLVVAPLAGGYPILLRDLVVALVRELGEVAVTDWPDARYVPKSVGDFGLDDNILHVEAMLRALGPGVHVVAVCQGVVPALAAAALLSAANDEAAPLSISLLGGPVDPLANPSRVVQLLRQRPLGWFEGNVIEEVDDLYPGRGRRVYPRTQQFTTFASYTLRHVAEGRELFWKLLVDDGEDPIRHPFMSLCWPLMDVPAELFLGTVSEVYQRASLAAGKLRVAGRRVDPGRIEHAGLATIEGEEDDIAAPGQTNAAHELCPHVPGDLRRRLLLPGSGHFSLFHGEKARKVVVPAIVELVEAATRSFTRRSRGRERSRRGQCQSDRRVGGTAPAGDRAGDATTAAKMARGRAKPNA